jgi:hypothetical protein
MHPTDQDQQPCVEHILRSHRATLPTGKTPGSTRAGVSKTSLSSSTKQQTTRRTSPRKWKTAGASESVSTSNAKIGPTSTLPAEVEQRKHELDGAKAASAKKKKSRKVVDLSIPHAIHMKLRAATEAGSKWEGDLEETLGLFDEEACMVLVGLVFKQMPKDEFPHFDPQTERYLALAKTGWHSLKEWKALLAKHPKENGE